MTEFTSGILIGMVGALFSVLLVLAIAGLV